MGFDSTWNPVEHRGHFNLGAFQGAKAAFDNHQPFIAACCILHADGVIVGFQNPFAVIFLGLAQRIYLMPFSVP